MSKQKDKASAVRNRIIEHRKMRAGDLVPNEQNFREHSDAQKQALQEIYQQVGFARSLLGYLLPDGRVKLLDGHLRQSLDAEQIVDVEILDVDEAEAAVILSSIDPIAAMARTNTAKQSALIASLQENSRATLQKILAGAANNSAAQVEQATNKPTTFKEIMPAPPMTWVLVGIETTKFGSIAQTVDELGKLPDILIETLSNGDG